MATPADFWQTTDLKGIDDGGLIREDVMEQIFDISRIPLPLMDAIGADTTDNTYTEWTTDRLGDPETGNWVVEGSDSDRNDARGGRRIGNTIGILTKEVQVSSSARAVNTIGRGDELSYQVMMRQRELRRNEEANLLGLQGNQSDDGDTVPGIPAGLAAMATQFDTGSAATGGGFAAGQWTAITPGARTGLTETMVRDAAQAAWEDGADPSLFMSVPAVIRRLSEYMFTSSSRIATLTAETRQEGPATAMGSVNVFLTDFGVTLDMVANRIQRTYLDDGGEEAAAGFLLDPAYARASRLRGYVVEPLAKTGLSDKRLMSVKTTLKVLEPDAHRVLLDLDPTSPVTQG